MIPASEWLADAQAVPLHKSRRFIHCGSGAAAVLYNKDQTWEIHCHRCHDGGTVVKPKPSLAETLARLAPVRSAEADARRTLALPKGQVHDVAQWPKEAAHWLMRYGFGVLDIAEHGIYWSAAVERLVLPAFGADRGDVVMWQARNVTDTVRPKVLSPRVDASRTVVKFGEGQPVLVEDMVSAMKLGMAGYEGIALLGTVLHNGVLDYLMRRRPLHHLFVWLDSDKPGRAGAVKVHRSLRAVGLQTIDIETEDDPKVYWRSEIQDLLGDDHEQRA